jgi:hypothetical protein
MDSLGPVSKRGQRETIARQPQQKHHYHTIPSVLEAETEYSSFNIEQLRLIDPPTSKTVSDRSPLLVVPIAVDKLRGMAFE